MNAFLGIDIFSGECHFDANEQSSSAIIAQYFADLAEKYVAIGIQKVVIFMDNNPTHKEKMQTLFRELTAGLPIELDFRFIATYSPKLNLVEYAIHKIRQKILHHADYRLNLAALKVRIHTLCEEGGIFSIEQIANILNYIQSLVYNEVS